jgi:hypothetical protein
MLEFILIYFSEHVYKILVVHQYFYFCITFFCFVGIQTNRRENQLNKASISDHCNTKYISLENSLKIFIR